MRKINIPKLQLIRLYVNQRLSSYKIAKIYHCDASVIQKRLRENNIELRSPKQKIIIPKSTLRKLYLEKGLSTYKIAKLYNCKNNTVHLKLKLANIKTRPLKRVLVSKEELAKLYHDKRLSLSKIAKKFRCSEAVVLDKMKKYGIERRHISEANTIYDKQDFEGDLIKKAYMIGFRLGDLNVTKSDRSSILKIKTSTTKIEQVRLLKKVFGCYGHFYVKQRSGVYGVECLMNESFIFLLPKKDLIEDWILKKKALFLAFLAGYTDAEGNIGIYSGRARFRLGSYDKKILKQIHFKLDQIGISNIFRLETPAGYNNQNGDFWRVSVNDKRDLLRLLQLLKPYLVHEKRYKDLKRAIGNILERNKKYGK